MSGILCAIRGGPNCRPTVTRAITMAKSTQLPLCFLYVVNVDSLPYAQGGLVSAISEKMRQMGQAVLFAARNKATALGIVSGAVVRQGDIGTEIINLCRDLDADYVILGRSVGHQGEDVFTRDSLKRLSQRIDREAGAQVVLSNCRDVCRWTEQVLKDGRRGVT